MEFAWAPLLESSALIAIGYNLKKFGILSELDGKIPPSYLGHPTPYTPNHSWLYPSQASPKPGPSHPAAVPDTPSHSPFSQAHCLHLAAAPNK
eukprot:gene3569-13648_t